MSTASPITTLQIPGNAPFKWSTLNHDQDSVTVKLEYNGKILYSNDITFDAEAKKVNGEASNGTVVGTIWANPTACFFSGALTVNDVQTILVEQEVVSVIYS